MSEGDHEIFEGNQSLKVSPGPFCSKLLRLVSVSAGAARASTPSQRATSTGRANCILSVRYDDSYALPFTVSLKDHLPEFERVRRKKVAVLPVG